MEGQFVKPRFLIALPLGLAAAALAACTVTTSVSGADLAEAAEDALEAEVGQRPDIDCGDADIDAEQDKEVTCVLTDPTSGTEYDTTVTFTGVDGTEWDIDVQVATEPN